MYLMVLIGGAEERVARGLPALYKASKNAHPLHIHLEDDNCSVFLNVN
jgi:hypothetical protein